MTKTARRSTALWHPFADMGTVSRSGECVLVRGDDMWLWDDRGRRYLDGTASLWYTMVGHGRHEIVSAIGDQLNRLEAFHTFGDFANEPALALAERLTALAPVDDGRVLLTSGGGDSVDSAAKLARRYWAELGQPQRTHLISRGDSYHGTHGFGTALAGIPANRVGYGELLADATVIPRDSAGALRETVARLGAESVAAFFVEPVIGAGGVHHPAPGYLEEVAEICRESGVLLVVDSTICGFGRLGNWFGIERWDVRPDMIVFAKGVTSGYLPLGGVVASGRVAEPFWSADSGAVLRHGATYSGHPACCAAACANLDLIETEGLLARSHELEAELQATVNGLADHPLVSEVRAGLGLMAALELDADFLARTSCSPAVVFAAARERGVIVRALGTSVAVSPPLTVASTHLELLHDALRGALDEVHATARAIPA
jgi:putrescine---pyruvate transaminase